MTRASDLAKLLGAGATILDGTTISTADNDAQLTLQSTDADSSSGPQLTLKRDSSSPADNDSIGKIKFISENDASEVVTYAEIYPTTPDVSNGTEDGQLHIDTMVAGTSRSRVKLMPAETVLNENSIDLDFRVESNGNANMLFVDGGNDKIGIGLNSPGTSLHIRSSTASNIAGYRDGTTGLIVEGDAASYIQLVASKTNPMAILFDGGDTHNDTARGGLIYDIDTGLSFKSGGSTRWTVNETGNLLPSATSLGIYLGVTSATASNLLDDYEEGTFTPVCSRTSTGSSHSYGFQHGNYTKIGRMINAKISIQITGTSTTGSGAMYITGLPFSNAISGAAGYANTALIHYNTALPGTGDFKSGHMYYADARIHFESDATAQDTAELNDAWQNGYISLQLIYYTS